MTENSVTAALTGVMYFSGNGTAVYLYGKRPGYPAAWKRMPENAMQCWGYAYAGEYSCFHHVHPLKQADSEEMKIFGAVLQQCWFISHDRGLDAFLTLQQAVWSSFATENPLTTKW